MNHAAFASTQRIGRALPVLDPAIDFQNIVVVPAIVAGFGCKIVPVILVTARPDHDIDRGPAT